MSRFLTLVCLCMLTASCASTNTSSLIGADTPANNVNRLVNVSVGESLDLDGATWTVERTYMAASGRVCKRLRGASGEERVGCQKPGKEWYLRKPLMRGASLPAPTPTPVRISQPVLKSDDRPSPEQSMDEIKVDTAAVSQAVSLNDIEDAAIVEDSDVTSEVLTVNENENLWRFAKRVTGNALNWEKIAAFNQLGDASAISAGQTLRVPSDMVLSGAGN